MLIVIEIIIVLLSLALTIVVLHDSIRPYIWNTKSKVYRVRYALDKDTYVAEKKFLCFWVKRYFDHSFRSEEDAVKFIRHHVNKQKKSSNPKIMDFNNMITDESRLLEGKNNKIENKYT